MLCRRNESILGKLLTRLMMSEEKQPLLCHFYPQDTFGRQVGMDRRKLSSDGQVVDDIHNCCRQGPYISIGLVSQCHVQSKL